MTAATPNLARIRILGDDALVADHYQRAFQEIIDLDGAGHDFAYLVGGLHDALVRHASFVAEHDPRVKTERHVQNDVARRRFLAHQMTVALTALAEFDARYPSTTSLRASLRGDRAAGSVEGLTHDHDRHCDPPCPCGCDWTSSCPRHELDRERVLPFRDAWTGLVCNSCNAVVREIEGAVSVRKCGACNSLAISHDDGAPFCGDCGSGAIVTVTGPAEYECVNRCAGFDDAGWRVAELDRP